MNTVLRSGSAVREEGLSVGSHMMYDVRAMWEPINEQVDALVQFHRCFTRPELRAIRWRGRRIDFRGLGQIESEPYAVKYMMTDGGTRYALRYEPSTQRWILEALDDSGFHVDSACGESP